MLGKRLIKSNDAGGGQVCRNIVDDYKPFNGGIALYQLNGNANDVSGNYNGTATDVTYGTGKFGQAGVFNGSSSKITLPNTAGVTLGSSATYAISFWFNAPNFNVEKRVFQMIPTSTTQNGIELSLTNTNKIQGAISNGTANGANANAQLFYSNDVLSESVWQHIVCVMNSGTLTLYLNGSLSTITLGGITNYAVSTNTIIGTDGYLQDYFNGSIDQVRIFDRALNSTEVSELYAEQVCYAVCASDEPDVFQDGSGVALYQLNWDGSDMSGNYDGVATDVSFANGKIDSAGSFNGGTSVLQASSSLLAADVFSFSMWFKLDALNSDFQHLMSQWASGDAARFLFYIVYSIHPTVPNTLAVQVGSSETFVGSQLSTDTWYNVVVVKDGSNGWTFYLNNSLIGTWSNTSNILTSNTTIGNVIAGQSNAPYGLIDQVRIFNKALSTDEVTTLYNEVACEKTCTTDDNQLVPDCVAYYKLDGNADDALNTYDGTPTNVSWTQGRFGSAANFPTIQNSAIVLGSVGGLFSTKSTISVSMWFRGTQTNTSNLWLINDYTSANFNILVYFNYTVGKLRMLSRYSNATTTIDSIATNLNDGNWHHLVVMTDIANLKNRMYVDGVFQSEGNLSSNSYSGSSVGAYLGGYDYTGDIDQVRIYDRAITAEEVTTLYNEVYCAAPIPTNTTAFYELDGNANDSSGNGYNGSISGSPTLVTGKFDTCYKMNQNNFVSLSALKSLGNVNTISMSFWQKLYQGNDTHLLMGGTTSQASYNDFIQLTPYNGFDTYYIDFGNIATGGRMSGTGASNWVTNEFKHFVFVKSATTMYWYVDGHLVNSKSNTKTVNFNNFSDLRLGMSQNAAASSGDTDIDQVRIYDFELDADQVLALYNE